MFPANPSYSYPHFNTYRLAAQPLRATSFLLPPGHEAGFPSSGADGGRVLGWKEAKARACWEALKVGRKDDEVLFVDREGMVVSVTFEQGNEEIAPIYTTLTALTLPEPRTSAHAPAEYPSVLAVQGTDYVLASAGDGRLSLLHSPANTHTIGEETGGAAALVKQYTIRWPRTETGSSFTGKEDGSNAAARGEETEEYSFLLQAVQPVYPGRSIISTIEPTTTLAADTGTAVGCHLVISRTIRIETSSTSTATATTSSSIPLAPQAYGGKKHDVQFQLVGIYMRFPPQSQKTSSAADDDSQKLDTEWSIQSGEAASYVRWLSASEEVDAKAYNGGGAGEGRSASRSGKWLIGGAERFTAFPSQSAHDEPSSDLQRLAVTSAVAGHGSSTTSNDDGQMVQESSGRDGNRAEQYPYSWTQTRESVTVTFELTFHSNNIDSTTAATEAARFDPNRDLLLHLSPATLDLRFPDRPTAQEEVQWTPAQRMFFSVLDAQGGRRDWWDTIDKGGTTWMFEWVDKEAGAEKERRGKLVLELHKANEGVKWASVFAPLQDTRRDAFVEEMQDDEDEDDDDGMTVQEMDIDVPETLTQEQIDASRAGLEQYHASIPDDNVPPPTTTNRFAGLGAIPPSMMGEPMDDDLVEFDDDPAFSGHVGGEPTVGGGASGGGEQGRLGTLMVLTQVSPAVSLNQGIRWNVSDAQTEGVWVLSTEVGVDPTLILKSHLDGQLFVPPRSLNSSTWTHESTNPALSFVLASKRDTQYVHHLNSPSSATGEAQGVTVIAFEARQMNGMGGNAYVYWPILEASKTKSGKNAAEVGSQAVVKFGEADGGVLLGVSRVVVGGQVAVVGLCERQLVVLQGL